MDANLQYYVLYVQTGREKETRDALQRLRFDARVPTELCTLRKGGKEKQVERTFFPGYVFCGVEEMTLAAWDTALTAARSVCNHARFLGAPTAIAHDELSLIGVIAPDSKPLPPSIVEFDAFGAPHILSGPLLSLPGHVVGFERRQNRARVALDVLGDTHILRMAITPVQKEADNVMVKATT
ncbi:MAG: transcription termination/antitermination NusG family protein [Ruthenibacterium sp.]